MVTWERCHVAPVAQLDRASGYEPEGRVFESLRAHHLSTPFSSILSLSPFSAAGGSMKYFAGFVVALALAGGAGAQQGKQAAGWTVLFNGTNLDNWTPIGNANWKLANGIVEANSGTGFLVSKNSYKD